MNRLKSKKIGFSGMGKDVLVQMIMIVGKV